MVNDKRDGSRNTLIIGVALAALFVCLLVAIAFVAGSDSISAQTHTLKLKLAGNGTVTDDQLSSTKRILENRLDKIGQGTPVNTVRDGQGNAYVLIKYGNIPYDDLVSMVTTPGVFEMRIQSQGNQSEHILYGDDVARESIAQQGTGEWGVDILLNTEGAQKFHDVASKYDIVGDSINHQVIFLLDGKEFHRAPLATSLAQELMKAPIDQGFIAAGTGDAGKNTANNLNTCLQSGILPTSLEVVDVDDGASGG